MSLNFKNQIAKIGGWLTEDEGIFLYKTAKKINSPKVIVEIGSWKGRSTICLGKGAQDGHKAKIYAIDPHTGSSEHQKMFNYPIDTYQEFVNNLKNAGVAYYIKPICKTSEEASNNFRDPIGFLFIDGAHEHRLVKLDYKLWFPKVINEGKIAFHDSWDYLGPHLVSAAVLFFSSRIKNPKLIDTITVFTKTRKNSFSDRIYNIFFLFYRLIVGLYGHLKLKYKGSAI